MAVDAVLDKGRVKREGCKDPLPFIISLVDLFTVFPQILVFPSVYTWCNYGMDEANVYQKGFGSLNSSDMDIDASTTIGEKMNSLGFLVIAVLMLFLLPVGLVLFAEIIAKQSFSSLVLRFNKLFGLSIPQPDLSKEGWLVSWEKYSLIGCVLAYAVSFLVSIPTTILSFLHFVFQRAGRLLNKAVACVVPTSYPRVFKPGQFSYTRSSGLRSNSGEFSRFASEKSENSQEERQTVLNSKEEAYPSLCQ